MDIDNLTILNIGKSTLNKLLQFWERNGIKVKPQGNFTFVLNDITYHFCYEYLGGEMYRIENYDFSPTILERKCK